MIFSKNEIKSLFRGKHPKILILILLVLLCMGITYYSLFILQTDIVFTHIFYIPIFIASLLWDWGALLVSSILVVNLLISHILFGKILLPSILIRSGIMIVIGLSISIYSINNLRKETILQGIKDYISNLFQFFNIPIMFLNRKREITLFNPAFEYLTGYSAKEILGNKLEILFPEKRQDEFIRKINHVLEREYNKNIELPIQCKNGHECITLWNTKNIYLPEEKNFIATVVQVQDMTSFKQAEEKLKEIHHELNQILETSPHGIWIIDKNFNVIRANKTFLDMAGINKENLLQKKCYELFKGDFCHTENCMVTRILSGEDYIECEVERQRSDGSKIPCMEFVRPHHNLNGEIVGIIAESRDISKLKEIYNELKSTKAYVEDIFANYLDTIIVTDSNGIIRMVNHATLELLEYQEEELIGKPVGIIFAEEEEEEEEVRPLFTGTLEELKRKGVMRDYELTYLTKSGKRIPMSFNASIMKNKKGQIIGIVAGAKDLTKIKQVEAELRQAQKMEALGLLAGGIAHDFNNILTGIKGYVQLTQLEISPSSSVYKNLKEIENLSNRASDLTQRILAFSRRQVLKPKNIDLNIVVSDLMKLIRRIVGEQISLKFIESKTPARLYADSSQIEQILLNLCVNAKEAMPEGGELIIEIKNILLGEDFCKSHPKTKPGQYVLLSIKDTGIGMDDATKERIFEPFFTTKGPDKGTGLGLSTVYGIVNQHDGFIQVFSKLEKGTTFEVYFPATANTQDQIKSQEIKIMRGNSETILVVEDEQTVRNLIEDFLKRTGYDVISTTNGKRAIEIFKNYKDKIDLVITDVIMPQMDGIKLYNKINKLASELKFIFISGYNIKSIHERFITENNLTLLHKPFSLAELSSKIRELLNERRIADTTE